MECHIVLRVLLISTYFVSVICWDNEDLEIFDLVEEVNTNFYHLLEVPEDANLTDIKKAFRRLSLNTHPDKSDAPDAEIRFRQLVAVYDVLKDSSKREKYDLVLKNGLPNWHEAVYYYRRVRRMGLLEMVFILFIIVTLGQYIVSWAAYMEKKYFAEQFISSKLKKMQKKQKKAKPDGTLPQEPIVEIPSPSVFDTLPLQLIRFVWFCLRTSPHCYGLLRDYWVEWKQRSEEEEGMEEEEGDDGTREKRVRRRKVFELPEIKEHERMMEGEGDGTCNSCSEDSMAKPITLGVPPISGGLWTEDNLAELVKQIKRYPPGTTDRWEKIAAAMYRSVPEVTFMARKVKEEGYRVGAVASAAAAGSLDGVSEDCLEKPRKIKTKGGKLGKVQQEASEENRKKETDSTEEDSNKTPSATLVTNNSQAMEVVWSQVEQKALENALAKYPKGANERWDKIAKCVPGKGKKECMLRYKVIVELVKKRKQMQDKPQTTETKDAEL